MDVGIGLPNWLLGVRGPELAEWARRAEGAGFSVLGTIGRIVYPGHEELIALAAAAAVTERIDLMTTVLLAPMRQPVLLAKQAATLDAISNGRFRLGVGIGARDDDWRAMGVEPSGRGARLEEVIATCRAVWAGEPPNGVANPVGPRPVNLPLVLGGYTEPAWRRAARLGDAFVAGSMPVEGTARAFQVVKQAAEEEGKVIPLYACRYAALGDDVREEADANSASYFGHGGDQVIQAVRNTILRTPDQVRETLDALRGLGADEVCLWPIAARMDQVERIAEAALG